MRRLAFSVLVLLLAIGGFLYQVRLAEAIPSARAALPLAAGVLLFGMLSIMLARGRLRILMAKPWLHYALAMVLLVALMLFGHRYRGGLYLPGRVNPSEFVKLFFVLFVAGHLAQNQEEDGRISLRTIAVQLAAFGGLALAIVAVRDFGLLAQLGITWAAILFVASVGWGLLVALGGGIAALTILAHPFGHLAVRVAVWRDPFSDATGAGWQTLQGLAALVSGGWWGKGMGMGEVHSVPIVSSDFVYAALSEELGFAGCAIILILWSILLIIPLVSNHGDSPRANGDSPREAMGKWLVMVGLVASLGCQLLLNVAGVLNVLPMTGITFPLLSQGGSSLVAVLAMCGILNAADSS
jgi:cell division protein FtsW (lipid II flippase)